MTPTIPHAEPDEVHAGRLASAFTVLGIEGQIRLGFRELRRLDEFDERFADETSAAHAEARAFRQSSREGWAVKLATAQRALELKTDAARGSIVGLRTEPGA